LPQKEVQRGNNLCEMSVQRCAASGADFCQQIAFAPLAAIETERFAASPSLQIHPALINFLVQDFSAELFAATWRRFRARDSPTHFSTLCSRQ
jgi:hypothetical protein